MKYKEMIEEAQSRGLTTEAMMWESVEDMENVLCMMKEAHPKEYWAFMRKQHGRLFKKHYTEEFAHHDVKKMTWTDKEGRKHSGEHWSCEDIEEVTRGMSFSSNVNKWDKYVAFNAFHADTCKVLDEDEIIKAAYHFWFADEDAPEGKVWIYMCAMSKHYEK